MATSGLVAYVQASCRCRKGYVCPFCRRWFPTLPPPSQTRSCDCGAALHRPESIKAARCFECRLLCDEPTNRKATHETRRVVPFLLRLTYERDYLGVCHATLYATAREPRPQIGRKSTVCTVGSPVMPAQADPGAIAAFLNPRKTRTKTMEKQVRRGRQGDRAEESPSQPQQ